jgi:hypothetical protein
MNDYIVTTDDKEYFLIAGEVPKHLRGVVKISYMQVTGSKMFSVNTNKFIEEKDAIMIRLKCQPIESYSE